MTGEDASKGGGDGLVQVRFAITEEDLEGAIAVRRAVFVEGQGYSEEQEFDEDDEGAIHIVATHLRACATTRDAERIVGTARLRVDKASDPTVATVGRVSVLPGDRGLGLGAALGLAAVADVVGDLLQGGRGHRHDPLLSPLAQHPDHPQVEVDVGRLQADEFAGAHPRGVQQRQHGAVPPPVEVLGPGGGVHEGLHGLVGDGGRQS